MTNDRRELHGELTPERSEERSATDGVGGEKPPSPVLDARGDGGVQGDDTGTSSERVESELTDEELIAVWESTVVGVRDGSIPTFDEKGALIENVMKRLGSRG